MAISPAMGSTIVGMALGGVLGAVGASVQPEAPGTGWSMALLGGGAGLGAGTLMIARSGTNTGPFLPLLSGAALGAGIVGLIRD